MTKETHLALELFWQWENRDSTAELNARLALLFSKGFFYGGRLSPIAGTLSCLRTPFAALGFDGTTVRDKQTQTFTYGVGINYHCVLAKSNSESFGGTVDLKEKSDYTPAGYSGDPEVNYLILLATVTVPPGATEILPAYVSYEARDDLGPYGRRYYRGAYPHFADLPVDPTIRTGDFALTLEDGSLYWYTGSIWTRICAAGASTLDGAYDDSAGTGVPGAGRVIATDAGAVELQQAVAAQRAQDLANAALRIRQEASVASGGIGLDQTISGMGLGYLGSNLVREPVVSGDNIHRVETVTVSSGPGGPITFTRAGVNLAAMTYGGTGKLLQLLEINGSALGNSGVFLFTYTEPNTGTVKNLDGTTPGMFAEPGLTACLFAIRALDGGKGSPIIWNGLSCGSQELLGSIGGTTPDGGGGKVFVYTTTAVGYLLRVYQLDVGALTPRVTVNSDGRVVLTPTATSPTDVGLLVDGYSANAGAALQGKNLGTGPGVRGQNNSSGPGITGSTRSIVQPAVQAEAPGEFGWDTDRYMMVRVPVQDFVPNGSSWAFSTATGSEDSYWSSYTAGLNLIQLRWNDFVQGSLLYAIYLDIDQNGLAPDVVISRLRVGRTVVPPPRPDPVGARVDDVLYSGTLPAATGRATVIFGEPFAPPTNFFSHGQEPGRADADQVTDTLVVHIGVTGVGCKLYGVFLTWQTRAPGNYFAVSTTPPPS